MAKKLTKEEESEIALLRASNEMYERTKAEIKKKGRGQKAIDRIEQVQEEIKARVGYIDTDLIETLDIAPEQTKKNNTNSVDVFSSNDYSIEDMLQSNNTKSNVVEPIKETEFVAQEVETKKEDIKIEEEVIDDTNLNIITDIDPNVQYDLVALPSNGECYKGKNTKIPVAYLTAYDENLITSPNLYKDGLVIDFLLKNKIVGNAINPDDLVSGDADAVTLFLRATSYGPDFPIIANDPDSGKQIETVVDLTKLKFREFKLKGDENGLFDFELPITKKVVKFRYLTRKQERDLKTLTKIENNGVKAQMLIENKNDLLRALIGDEIITATEKTEIEKVGGIMERWSNALKAKSGIEYNRLITNMMQLQVVSIDGNSDRNFVRKFINEMPARDSLMLRKYINDNRPGVNFEVEVERPANLGGGSFKTFLNWDDSVFLNIPGI